MKKTQATATLGALFLTGLLALGGALPGLASLTLAFLAKATLAVGTGLMGASMAFQRSADSQGERLWWGLLALAVIVGSAWVVLVAWISVPKVLQVGVFLVVLAGITYTLATQYSRLEPR